MLYMYVTMYASKASKTLKTNTPDVVYLKGTVIYTVYKSQKM